MNIKCYVIINLVSLKLINVFFFRGFVNNAQIRKHSQWKQYLVVWVSQYIHIYRGCLGKYKNSYVFSSMVTGNSPSLQKKRTPLPTATSRYYLATWPLKTLYPLHCPPLQTKDNQNFFCKCHWEFAMLPINTCIIACVSTETHLESKKIEGFVLIHELYPPGTPMWQSICSKLCVLCLIH